MEGCSSPGQGSPAGVEEGAAAALATLASPCVLGWAPKEVRLWPPDSCPPPPSLQRGVQPPGAGFQSSPEDAACQRVMESRMWGSYPSRGWRVQQTDIPPTCALLGRLGSPRLPSISAPRRVPTMPVVGVLLWATLLTLGWRAAHPKDHGFATPRVQLSFKGKSLVVEVGGRVGPQDGGNHGHPSTGSSSSSSLGGHQQSAPSEFSMGIHIQVWLSSQSAPAHAVLGGW